MSDSPVATNDLAVEIVYFDPKGDVRLILPNGSSNAVFVVSSKAMTLACKAWNRMLAPDGYFQEAQPGSEREVPLPEDNATALAILLNIAHLHFTKVPPSLSFSELLAVAVLTDKYGATELVLPWVERWTDKVKNLLLVPLHEEWLWISWEFGDLYSFKSLADNLVNTVRTDQSGGCVTAAGRVLDPLDERSFLPPGIIESVLETRQTIVSKMLDAFFQHVDRQVRARSRNETICNNRKKRFECDQLASTWLSRTILNAGLSLDKRDPTGIHWSIEELSTKLRGSLNFALHDQGNLSSVCENARFYYEVQAAVTVARDLEGPSVVLESHCRHVDRQRRVLDGTA